MKELRDLKVWTIHEAKPTSVKQKCVGTERDTGIRVLTVQSGFLLSNTPNTSAPNEALGSEASVGEEQRMCVVR